MDKDGNALSGLTPLVEAKYIQEFLAADGKEGKCADENYNPNAQDNLEQDNKNGRLIAAQPEFDPREFLEQYAQKIRPKAAQV